MASRETGSVGASRRLRAAERPRRQMLLRRLRAIHEALASERPSGDTAASLLHEISLLAATPPEALGTGQADDLMLLAGRLAAVLRRERSAGEPGPRPLWPLLEGLAGEGRPWGEVPEGESNLTPAEGRLEALNRAAAALAGDLELEHVLQAIVAQAVEGLQAAAAILLLPAEAGEAYEVRAQSGLGPEVVPGLSIPEAGVASLAGSGLIRFGTGDDDVPQWARDVLGPARGGPLAALPLRQDGRLAGLLLLLGHEQDWQGPAEAEALAAFAAQAALALSNASHHRETEGAAAETTFLLQISQLLNSTFDAAAIVQTLVDEASDLVPSEICALYLYDPIGDEIELRAVEGVTAEQVANAGLQRLSLALVPGTRRAAAAGQPTIGGGADAGDLPSLYRAAFQMHSSMTVPLRARGSLLGFLLLMRQAPRHFGLGEMELALKLGTLAALALDNARLYANLTEQMQQVRATQAQLIEVEKMASLGRIVAGVAHELNNPLAIISGYAQMLLDGGVPPELRADLERIDRGARRAAQVVRELLAFARQQPIIPTSIDVPALVDDVLEQELPALREARIKVEVAVGPGLPRIRGDRLQISQVLSQLIANARHAIAARPGAGTVTIGATYDGRVQVTVADDGPGIPAHLLDKVFEPFLTTQEIGQGMGLGLSMCYGVVRAHGGRIWATNNPGYGATFHVELPAVGREERAPR